VLPDATPAGPSGPFAEPNFPASGELDLGDDVEESADFGNRAHVASASGEESADLGNRAHVASASGEEDLLEDGAGNRAPGGLARAVLEHIARSIVDEPDAVEIDVSEGRSGVRLSLRVAPSDMGRVIGRRGRVAQALRVLVRAAAAREGTDAVVDIVDD
jgi:predicted RNA-binding protein YlqC (UPF0109 family)